MKKCILLLAAVMMAMSLAACTPTPEKNAAQATVPSSETIKADTMEERNKGNENLPVYATVAIYRIKKNGDGLLQEMESLETEELDAQAIIDLMIQYEILNEGTEIISFDEGTEGIGTLNLNQIIDAEEDLQIRLVVQSIVNTFTENYELDGLILQENGEVYTIDSIESEEDGTMYYDSDYRNMAE